MAELVRFGVSMERDLVEKLDALTDFQGLPNRSETLRSLVRAQIMDQSALDDSAHVTAVVSLILNHGTKLARIGIEQYPSLKILTNMQQHLQGNCIIKIMVITGTNAEVRKWAGELIGQKHVVGRLTIAATDQLVQDLE